MWAAGKVLNHKNTPARVCFCVLHAFGGERKALDTETTPKRWFSCSTCIAAQERCRTRKHIQQGCVSTFGIHPGWRKGAELKNTPSLVCFRVRRASRVKERRRTRKHTNDGVFSCSTCIGVKRKVSNTKIHQRGCVSVFAMHRGDNRGVEHENTPTRVFFRVRRASGVKERRRTRKYTKEGVFRVRRASGWQERRPMQKHTHCGWFSMRRNCGCCTTTNLSVKI